MPDPIQDPSAARFAESIRTLRGEGESGQGDSQRPAIGREASGTGGPSQAPGAAGQSDGNAILPNAGGGDSQLSGPPEALEQAESLLTDIGKRFTELRKGGKAPAWLKLQEDLMTNIGVLVPIVIPLKDFLAACREIEEFVKGATSQPGRSNSEILRDFLGNGSIQLESSAIKLVEIPLDNPPAEVVLAQAGVVAERTEQAEQAS